jgi:two-component system, sensor histidine kinase
MGVRNTPAKSARRGRRRQKPRHSAARQKARQARVVEAALAAFAHDIRTPLTGILALGELLASSDLDARERAWAEAVKSSAEYLAQLATLTVDAAKAGSKGLALRRDAFSPRALTEAMAVSLAARAETRGLASSVEMKGDLPDTVVGDAVRLRAVLENLIDNAVKFTASGGVTLAVAAARAPRGRMKLTFTVNDSGIGLKPAEVKRLFRPFAQANPDVAQRFGGSGLGLAMVKRIAKAMGGDLTVKSTAGRGSRFQLTALVDPVAAAGGAGAAHPARIRTAPARSLRILCAEDNPYGRVILNTILTELGHRADFVGSGEAAVEAVKGGDYDVVLLDIVLSGIDGLETTRRIRALDDGAGRVPIIGVSGRGERAEEEAARAAGMDNYLTKPLGPSALAKALAGVVGKA